MNNPYTSDRIYAPVLATAPVVVPPQPTAMPPNVAGNYVFTGGYWVINPLLGSYPPVGGTNYVF